MIDTPDRGTVVILRRVRTRTGWGTLYYHAGNFFWPFLSLAPQENSRVTRAIRQWSREHADTVAKDRARPDYLTLAEMVDKLDSSL